MSREVMGGVVGASQGWAEQMRLIVDVRVREWVVDVGPGNRVEARYQIEIRREGSDEWKEIEKVWGPPE